METFQQLYFDGKVSFRGLFGCDGIPPWLKPVSRFTLDFSGFSYWEWFLRWFSTAESGWRTGPWPLWPVVTTFTPFGFWGPVNDIHFGCHRHINKEGNLEEFCGTNVENCCLIKIQKPALKVKKCWFGMYGWGTPLPHLLVAILSWSDWCYFRKKPNQMGVLLLLKSMVLSKQSENCLKDYRDLAKEPSEKPNGLYIRSNWFGDGRTCGNQKIDHFLRASTWFFDDDGLFFGNMDYKCCNIKTDRGLFMNKYIFPWSRHPIH